MDEEAKQFMDKVSEICEAMGYAEIESDDSSDRWLSFTQNELVAEVRSRWMDCGQNDAVWEVTIRRGYKTLAIDYVERKNA